MSTEQARMEPVAPSGAGANDSTPQHAEDPTFTGNPSASNWTGIETPTNRPGSESEHIATGATGGARAEAGASGSDSSASASQPSSSGAHGEADLPRELREFGKQIEAVITTARTSPRGREIEEQLTTAWRDLEKGVNTTLSKAQSGDFKTTMTGTAQYAADELQLTLARGLRSLNQWLGQKVQAADERRRQREQDISRAAAQGTADNEVRDRFGGDAPIFGQDLHVPSAPVQVTPDPTAAERPDTVVTERFDDRPPSFGEPSI